MKKRYIILSFCLSLLFGNKIIAQSTNCSTATNISLSTGSACVNGTSAGAVTDNILYGACNAAPVNIVWYTYVANGSNNTFTVTPGTLTKPEIIIYTGGCPSTGALQTCNTATGSNVLTTAWGMTLGQQVWVGVASNGGTDGTFQLCINSTPPAVGAGNTCSQSIPICSTTFSQPTMAVNASGQSSACFGSAPQRDIWISFTITQAGMLAWKATPVLASTEFDWTLWDITGGCPGTTACCNYNYAGGSSAGFGMQSQAGTVACGYNSVSNVSAKEFCAPIAVTCGKTYAIQISNYTNNNKGFTLTFPGATCMISSSAAFTASPPLICGSNLTAAISSTSTGACAAVWSFGDGSANYNGATPPNHTYNSPGTYAITETIGGACPSTATQFVQLLAPLAATVTPTNPICYSAACAGTATVNSVSGGDGIYTYTWSAGGSTTNTAAGLCDGMNTVTVSNAKCGTSITQTVNIVTPPALTITATPTNLTSCTINNGSISVAGSGGTPGYTYALNAGTFGVATTFSNLAAGTYSLYIKDSKGCQTYTTTTLTAPLSPTVTVNSATICPGASATLTATGATTYSWNPSFSGNPNIVSPGVTTIYTVTGTAAGCSASATATVTIGTGVSITVPSATICAGTSTTLTATGATNYTWTPGATLSSTTGSTVTASPLTTTTYTISGATGSCTGTTTAVVTINTISASITTLPTTCTGSTGSATATCTGVAPYTYTWSTTPTQNTQTITSLPQGSYSVSVQDVNGCMATATGTVNTQGFTWTASATGTNPKCFGSSDGTATVSVTNPGASTFSYSWTTSPVQTNSVSTGLSASSYTAYVTDNNGCVSSSSLTLTNPVPITATVNTTSTTCTGSIGSATATCSGLAPYTYTWTTTANTYTINNLPQGPYGVAITDANGCVATASTTVGTQSFVWTASATGTNPKCVGSSDGTATVSITNPGTSAPFTYSWTTSPVQTNSVATSLSANSYTAYITDNNGCTSSASLTLVNPAPITATVNTTPTICTGSVGSATATCTGLAPFTYVWTNSAITYTVNNLPQGSCGVAVTDANGCLAIASGIVGTQGYTWIPVATSTPTKCFGSSDGTATVTMTNAGSSIPVSYTWTPTLQSTAIATNLPVGIYSVSITDNNSCVGTTSVAVTQPTKLVSNTQTSAAICTAANGTAYAVSFGGTLPYASYSWNVTTPSQTTQTATGLTQGQYTVTVTDANGCQASAIAVVRDTTDLTVTASQSRDLCSKGVGKAIANPTGQSPYIYSWTDTKNQTTQTADSLKAGTYSVNVTDANGCTASAVTTVINQNDVLASQFITSPQGEIDAENETALTISANSGWSVTSAYLTDSAATIHTPITSNPFNYVFPKYGSYSATYYYTSVNGCKDTIKELIIVKDYMTIYIPNAFSPNGDGFNETFSVAGTLIKTFEMYIYDRWGVLVIRLDDINKGWDGTENGGPAQEDTYVYKGAAYDVFGKHVSFQGQVTLIR